MIPHIPEERRLAAVAELAELIGDLNASAASLTKRMVLLSANGPLHKVCRSLKRYRCHARLRCQDDVAAIEARLLGVPTEAMGEADRRRREEKVAKDASWEAMRSSYHKLSDDEWNMVWELQRLPEKDKAGLVELATNLAITRRRRLRGEVTLPAPEPKPKSFPFEVITGGAA